MIDGVIDEIVWQSAAVVTDFRQVEPTEGAPASETTEVRILYDSDAIYIAIRAYDSEPDKIRAAMQVRDGKQNPDDNVSIVIDSLDRGRDAFVFQVNPLGARTDMVIENNATKIPEWDGIWYASARQTDSGWQAELEIPVKTLSFDAGTTSWGFNIVRLIRRKNEEVRWSSVSRTLKFENVSQLGRIEGLTGLDQGMGLDVKVSGALGYVDDRNGSDGFEFDPTIDVFYNFTPSLAGSLTLNTDFAEAAVDERQVNLSRFSLFFPETRDFFLKDAGIFEFGNLSNFSRNGRPFFTRRIGISDDSMVDIIAGAKLTGHVGPVNIGLMDVQMDSDGPLDAKNLSVGRVAVNVLSESSVGAIVTNGDPATNDNNSVVGADFRYRDSKLFGNRVIEGAAWFQKSFTTGIDEDEMAWGLSLLYPNDEFFWELGFKDIGENFNPALGFANRVGVRQYKVFPRYRWRPKDNWWRTIDIRVFANIYTDQQNRLETQIVNTSFWLVSDTDDRLTFAALTTREVLREPFELPSNLVIPTGDYFFTRGWLAVESSRARPIAARIEIECCDYFEGRRFSLESWVELRTSKEFFFRLRYDYDNIDVPWGDARIRVTALELNYNITPDIQWANIIQYDNVSDDIGISSRFKWIIKPGNELFVAVNQNIIADQWDFRRERSEAKVKIGHTFRF